MAKTKKRKQHKKIKSSCNQDALLKQKIRDLLVGIGFQVVAEPDTDSCKIFKPKPNDKQWDCEFDGIYYSSKTRTLIFIEATVSKGDKDSVSADYNKVTIYAEVYKKRFGLETKVGKTILLEIADAFSDSSGMIGKLRDNIEPKLITFDRKTMLYYEDLYSKLGKYIEFELLKDLTIKHNEDALHVPAVGMTLNGSVIYMFSMSAESLMKCCYVYRKEQTSKGYQRLLSKEKLNNIRSYFNSRSSEALFPNSILLNFMGLVDGGKAKPTSPVNMNLDIPIEYSSYHVIDGQHRLYSYAGLPSFVGERLIVVAFDNLSEEAERRFFISINKNQNKIDSSLLTTLLAETEFKENEAEYIESQAAKFVLTLNTKEKGLFNAMIDVQMDVTDLEPKRDKETLTLKSATEYIRTSRLLPYMKKSKTKSPVIEDGYIKGQKMNMDDAVTEFEQLYSLLLDKDNESNRRFFYQNRGFGLVCKLIQGYYKNIKSKNLPKTVSINDLLTKVKFTEKEIEVMLRGYGPAGFSEIVALAQYRIREIYPGFKISKKDKSAILDLIAKN